MAESTIKTRITLEGAEDIKAKLKDLGQTGEKAFKQIKDAGGAAADGGKAAAQHLQALGLRSLEARSATEKFREALHVAHPVLEAGGLGMENLGAFAVAARAGIRRACSGNYGLGAART